MNDVTDFINHINYLALQGLAWTEARKELRETFNVSADILRGARRTFLAAARRAA